MSIENNIFLKYTPDFKKLTDFGFLKKGKNYFYETLFFNGEFKALIFIDSKGKVYGDVYDTENGEKYLPLKLENQEGAFVGKVKESYIKILEKIRDKCFIKNTFVSAQGNRIAKLILEKYGDNPLFMWDDMPTAGVFKNMASSKWYGIIMYVQKTKLSKDADGWVEIINLKLDKEEIQNLLKDDGFYPAWHMNKKSWITLVLDETLRDNKVMQYIEESHSYTVKKRSEH